MNHTGGAVRSRARAGSHGEVPSSSADTASPWLVKPTRSARRATVACRAHAVAAPAGRTLSGVDGLRLHHVPQLRLNGMSWIIGPSSGADLAWRLRPLRDVNSVAPGRMASSAVWRMASAACDKPSAVPRPA